MRRVIAGRLVLSHIDMKPVDLDSDVTEGFILCLMGQWIRIGDFARMAEVTVRALRHYEEEGLLLFVR